MLIVLLHAGMDSSETSCNGNCALTLPRIEQSRTEQGSFLSAGTSFFSSELINPHPSCVPVWRCNICWTAQKLPEDRYGSSWGRHCPGPEVAAFSQKQFLNGCYIQWLYKQSCANSSQRIIPWCFATPHHLHNRSMKQLKPFMFSA